MKHKPTKYQFRIRGSETLISFQWGSPSIFEDKITREADGRIWYRYRSKLDNAWIYCDFVQVLNPPVNAPGAGWPMESDSMGVELSQIADARQAAVAMGVPIDFNPETGAAIFETAGQRRRYCEAMEIYDRNGGYGDPQRRTHQERESRAGV